MLSAEGRFLDIEKLGRDDCGTAGGIESQRIIVCEMEMRSDVHAGI